MIIWRNLIKSIFKSSLPTIIIPVTVVALVIYYFEFTIQSLMAIIFLAQFYIIWAQLEVALRQTHLSALEYEPEFKIEMKRSEVINASKGKIVDYTAKLKNIGKHLAWNVFVSVEIDSAIANLSKPFISNIAPGEVVDLHSFPENRFNQSRIIIHLDYENIQREFVGITYTKIPKLQEFVISKTVEMPGILLKSFENLISISRLFTLSRRTKKIHEIMKPKKP